jgi:hypothetical protein
MKCSGDNVGTANPSKYPCGVCRKGVGDNSIQGTKCKQWVHKRCSKIKGPLRAIVDFKCAGCLMGNVGATTCKTNTEKKLTLEQGVEFDYVKEFCYLGDMISSAGGAGSATVMRVKCA